jgi:2',3'-cyclic-nucleotide 2'-phosphodiesterase (5'-nucleotidase family)
MGGLPRRATFIKQHIEQGTPVLIADSGNLFAQKPTPQRAMKSTLAKAELIVRAYDAMGYVAAAAGEMDLYLGRDELTRLFAESSMSLLSANLLDSDGRPVFAPYKIVEAGNTRVAFIGLTAASVPVKLLDERLPGCSVADPVESAGRAVREVRGKADLVVILSRLGYMEDMKLVSEVEGIDVVIGGRDRRWMRVPRQVGQSLVTSAFFEGRAMGWLELSLHGPVNGWIQGTQLDFMQSQLQKAEGLSGTPEEVAEEQLAELRKQYNEALSRTTFRGNMVNLMPQTPDDPEMAAMIADYRKELAESAGKADPADTTTESVRYVGAAPCLACHVGRHRFWRDTDHARAIDSLKEKGAHADPDCLQCHTTGFDVGSRGVIHLGVQCEACHGKGSLHVSWPETYPLLAVPPASVCGECHTPEQDDDFQYMRDKGLVCSESH